MKFEQPQTDYVSFTLPMIENASNRAALKKTTSNSQIESKLFYDQKMRGVFFSYTYNERLRIYITFEDDTDVHNEEIAILFQSSIEKGSCTDGLLWIRKENKKIIEYVKEKFLITTSDELFFYESTAFILYREKFDERFDHSVLEIKQYQDSYIDECLLLLDEAMTFKMPPHFFRDEREHYLEQFGFYKDNVVFETFWKSDQLIGLYWLNGEEIDCIAVSNRYQRMGYGSSILTRAIEMVFQTDK